MPRVAVATFGRNADVTLKTSPGSARLLAMKINAGINVKWFGADFISNSTPNGVVYLNNGAMRQRSRALK